MLNIIIIRIKAATGLNFFVTSTCLIDGALTVSVPLDQTYVNEEDVEPKLVAWCAGKKELDL